MIKRTVSLVASTRRCGKSSLAIGAAVYTNAGDVSLLEVAWLSLARGLGLHTALTSIQLFDSLHSRSH
jgi:hypothetical protein